ncbi:MAG: HAD-IG family 5'-nucleotidase [Acidimicrobiia bacterium]|nr:HAD-IG family 5'-nucleotidase [Acidimicrobiia bacterium]
MPEPVPPSRRIYANRTLNLRSIKAIGYDMDYTLAHYHADAWERRAYRYTRDALAARGWRVDHLEFDPLRVIRGLTIDLALGNLVKPTRFGYVIRASHGTRFLEFDELRQTYAGTVIDLSEERYVFLNTLFSLSEALLFAQLVDELDAGNLPHGISYADVYEAVRSSLDDAHMEGALKGEIIADPDRFVVDDPELPATLLDQKHAGKQLLLITNSEWAYTRRMMPLVVDPHLPGDTTWRDLFDMVVVSAAKPRFFSGRNALFRVVDEEQGLLEPERGSIEMGRVYYGGCASTIEAELGCEADEILYVGDHLFADVHVSKDTLRWRTALILRELEEEIDALEGFRDDEARLVRLMGEKEAAEHDLAEARLARMRASDDDRAAHDERVRDLRARLAELDDRIAPLAQAAGALGNADWGLLMRSGYDKSLFARQVERYADVYTSRVSNFLAATPFGFLRAARSSLPHDT